jgi:hypothetical protein
MFSFRPVDFICLWAPEGNILPPASSRESGALEKKDDENLPPCVVVGEAEEPYNLRGVVAHLQQR